jgi:lipid-binding SYLF domain-containing protein
MKNKCKTIYAVTVYCILLLPSAVFADGERDKIADATDVIREIMQSPDQGIPYDLLQKSAAVAIFPGVIKAGLVVGAEYGQGVILHHDATSGRWSAPAFFSIAAGSVGWQIGAQSTDLILLIRNDRGLKAILRNEFKLGVDLSVAAGPVGRKAQAGTDITFETEVWSYSRSRGLFAGIALEGARVYSQEDSNAAYYGQNLSARDILLGADIKKPESALRLIHTMEDFSISYQE